MLCVVFIGQLRKYMKLQPRSLVDLLKRRYKWKDEDAEEFSDFLLPMLDYDPRRRATAEQSLRHPWLHIRQSPTTSTEANPSTPPVIQQDSKQDSVESPSEAVMPEMETPAPVSVVGDTKCDVMTADTDKDDKVLPMTIPTTVDTNA